MYDGDSRNLQRMAPRLKRVLIVDPQPMAARLLTELMRDLIHAHISIAPTLERALRLAQEADPQVIFTEIGADGLDGLAFTRTLRKSTWNCRMAPVIATASAAKASLILSARDAGVHEFLVKPFSMKDLVRRLEAVTLRDRDWIEGMHYIGPDRRRFNSGDYAGPLKRRTDGSETPYQQKINQALKIIRAAVAAADSDPAQAMRAMLAQVTDLQQSAKDLHLTVAASELYGRLHKFAQGGERITTKLATAWTGPILAFLCEDQAKAAKPSSSAAA